MKKKLSPVVVLLFTCGALLAAQSTSADVQAKSKEVVGQLAARQFDKVEALFDSTMASALPADKLAATWDSVLAQAGKFKSAGETRQEELRGTALFSSPANSTAPPWM